MTTTTILGAGLAGLTTAMMLNRDGHEVTVLERDPAVPADRPWDDWDRPGVNQFRLPHYLLPRWWAELRAELPGAAAAVHAAGAAVINPLAALPPEIRGPDRDGDDRFTTVTARRPVLEAALVAAATAAGVSIRRGVRVTGVRTDGRRPVPRVTGVTTTGGAVSADLVIDCGGRRSPLPAWLAAAGARPVAEERADAGFVYYARHFRSPHGRLPEIRSMLNQPYDSLSVLTLPADHGTWSVVLTTSGKDKALRALREPAIWSAAVGHYPAAAPWLAAEPITGVDVMAGLEDRLRRYVVNGRPVATGVVAVGDAWACTNPSLGRGASFAIVHARVLRDVLREVGAADHDKLVRRFDEATAQVVEPLYRATNFVDTHRLAEIDGDVAGVPYRPDDLRWLASKALFAAALRDPGALRGYLSISSFLDTPDEVFATPGLRDRVLALGLPAPQYPLPGPSRAELLAAVTAGAR
ncbi:FAD-dependent oxidoreductase [Actinoplanes sp. GCM10030250]|uniref:FAD-dependent oxidoreductase n=1 Tax=Actinoplanes sp. GCM10030250 TaxID=3273376 RepID=UPI0036164B6A